MNFDNCIILIVFFLVIFIIGCLIMSGISKKKNKIESFENNDRNEPDKEENEEQIKINAENIINNSQDNNQLNENEVIDINEDVEQEDDSPYEEDFDEDEIYEKPMTDSKSMPIPSSILTSSKTSPIETIKMVSRKPSNQDTVQIKQYSVTEKNRPKHRKRYSKCPKTGDNIFWEPQPNILSPYGYVYMPNTVWEVPQKRDPICKTGSKNMVCPVYTSGTPDDALEYGKIGNNLKTI